MSQEELDYPLSHAVAFRQLFRLVGAGTFCRSPEFIDHAAELGFDGVELMARRPHLSLLD